LPVVHDFAAATCSTFGTVTSAVAFWMVSPSVPPGGVETNALGPASRSSAGPTFALIAELYPSPPIWGAVGGGAGTTIDWVGLSSTVAVAGTSLKGLRLAGLNVVKKKKSSKVTTRLGSRLLNLTVDGNAIPVNVAPNTKLDLAGVGTLVINERVKQRWGGYVRALHLTLTTAQYGLPVGAEIEVGVALGWVATG
jgi:hypothetical protein